MIRNIFIFMVLLSSTLKSQTTNVSFALDIKEDRDKEKFNISNEMYLQAIEGAKNIKYELLFDKSRSLFKVKSINDIEEAITENALAEGAVYKAILIENDSVFLNNRSTFFPENKYLISDPINNLWEITSEEKVILGMTCKKATTIYVVNNGRGIFKHPVTAWYSLEIPSKFGPKGYGGLPGLILELQIRKVFYKAVKIEIVTDEIKFTKKGIKISNQEYNELIRKAVNFKKN